MPYKRIRNNKTKWVGEHQRTLANGKTKKVSGVFETKKDALAWEADQRKKSNAELFPQELASHATPTESLTVMAWANDYLDYVRINQGKNTFFEKRRAFRTLIDQVGPTFLVKDLTASLVQKALLERTKGMSGNAANCDLKNLKAAWAYSLESTAGFPKGVPAPFPKRKMAETRHPRYVPPEENFWQVVEVSEGQDRVMLIAYFSLAARRSEIYRLQLRDLDFKRKLVRLYTRKRRDGTEEFDWLPMPQPLEDALRSHIAVKGLGQPDDYLFVNETPDPRKTGRPFQNRRHWLKTACAKAGVPYFHLHAIRHLTASVLDDQGESLTTIQKIMRHKNPETTVKYLHQLRSERDALERMSLRVPSASPVSTKKARLNKAA